MTANNTIILFSFLNSGHLQALRRQRSASSEILLASGLSAVLFHNGT